MKIVNIACATVLMAFTLVMPRTAHAQVVTPPVVPAGLEVDAPNQAFLLGHAQANVAPGPLPECSAPHKG